VVLGECKDEGPIELAEFSRDVENLRRVADSFPRDNFETYILLSKLAPFSPEEVEAARRLNEPRRAPRVILLTPRELEPYHLTERLKAVLGKIEPIIDPQETAHLTHRIYFSNTPAT
jgi:hypothetical protein